METVVSGQKILVLKDGTELAVATFPFINDAKDVIDLNTVVVDESLRGQGVAGNLVQKVVELSREKGWKIQPTCTYALAWFKKHTEHHDLLIAPLEN